MKKVLLAMRRSELLPGEYATARDGIDKIWPAIKVNSVRAQNSAPYLSPFQGHIQTFEGKCEHPTLT